MNNNREENGVVTRRDFVLLTAAAALGTCCGALNAAPPRAPQVVDAGPAGNYAAGKVYAQFRNRGFFIIRSGRKLIALSAVCTHRRCKLDTEPDRTFSCPCHGSTFDASGKVTEGPAKRDLPWLPTATDARGHLLVTVV